MICLRMDSDVDFLVRYFGVVALYLNNIDSLNVCGILLYKRTVSMSNFNWIELFSNLI